jgi:hypothetical protein
MHRLIPAIALSCLIVAPATAQQRPRFKDRVLAVAERHLAPCPEPRAEVCSGTRELFLLVWPDAWLSQPRQMRRVAEMLAEGSAPPIKRDLVEACAWASVAASVGAERGADGVTVPQAERDMLVRQCLRYGDKHALAGRARAQRLLVEMTEMLRP